MFEQAFDAAQRRGSFPNFDVGSGRDGSGLAGFEADRKHRPEAASHLAASDFVASETWEAGIQDLGDRGMLGKSFGQTLSRRGGPADSRVQSSQAAHQQPCLERTKHSARLRSDGADSFPIAVGIGGETGEEIGWPDG